MLTTTLNLDNALTNELIMKRIFEDLERMSSGLKKINHWAWYVFPIYKVGNSDSRKTSLKDHQQIKEFFTNERTQYGRRMLNLIFGKLKGIYKKCKTRENFIKLFPVLDHNKIKIFSITMNKDKNRKILQDEKMNNIFWFVSNF